MKILTKSLLSAGAAAAALVSVAAPAQARHDDDRISAGEVIAGAVILGGLAAVIASSDDRNDRDYRYDRAGYDDGDYRRGGYDRGYGYSNRYGGSRAAVNQCVNAVERWASRYSRSDVTQISNIDRTRNGYRVTGKLVVQDGWRGNNRGYDSKRYDRDDYGNRGHGYNRGYDKGRFTCFVERGRVVDVDYRGLDQWR
ncbi:hypothetical protein [uncultured Sphingorhabdus sp.]|uniref:hypothetical protein n=1 Tax=uncultured Sphingorhabdus sp. TaxID=1686106 RepID=UPI0026149708|nr:hypothetical protein [uncultured Sphingorhabdus sp.]HMS20721.1 hypothetical protein [Sphingorhabdus sp.]